MTDNKGFTLIEILVTIALVAFGVLALLGLQVTNLRGTAFNKDAGAATALLQKTAEDLKNTAFDSIATDSTGVTAGGKTATWSVTSYGATPHRYKEVTVNVAWGTNNIQCHTVITEP